MELEKELALFLNKEAALTFSTGFQTNLGIISSIAGRNDYIICDNENHASIIDGCRLSFANLSSMNTMIWKTWKRNSTIYLINAEN